MKNYKNYQGRRGNQGRRLLTVLLALVLIGVLAFSGLLGVVLSGSHDEVSGEPQVMIVLGCQVKSWGPSILLQDRLDEALDYLSDHPDMTVVVSGGQGPDEHISEAQAMYDYLVEHGVEAGSIVLEDQSHNTSQNLTHSKAILEELGYQVEGNVLVVSNGFHLTRVRLLAERSGLGAVSTLAAPSSHWPSRLKMYLREPLALVKSFLFD
jgi:uncharacterized SAM-binding protein YcdF (DUF218 family)